MSKILLGVFFIFVGIGFECYLVWKLCVIFSCTEEVEGTLVDIEAIPPRRISSSGNRRQSLRPTYRYKYKHCWYTSKAMLSFLHFSEEKKYKKGRKYAIYINPKKPKECITSRFQTEEIAYLIIFFFGGIAELLSGIHFLLR
ncbi:MAG: DUF3592 domain-containing protein [Butyrivibrio sp.]|nr:DUF3592 domain-containing protein [Butyrivibrio sp.]